MIEKPLIIGFDNNRLLRALVSMAKTLFALNRLWGSRLPIAAIRFSSQAMHRRARAELVLNTLYHQLERGGQIGGGDVDGAVRLSLGVRPRRMLPTGRAA